MRITPKNELEHRLKRLQKQMGLQGVEAVIIIQNADLFYFTASIQSGTLYVPVDREPIYMVRRDFSRARMESGLRDVVPISTLKDITPILSHYGYPLPASIGMELDVVPVNMLERYRMVFPRAEFVDASFLIRKIRMIKSHYEIHVQQDAATQADKVYLRVKEVLQEGMTDIRLASELEYLARNDGHQGMVRVRAFNGELVYGHVFSGTDAAVPSYFDSPLGGMGPGPCFPLGASWKLIGRNEPVIVDFVGSCDGYLVDQTRVFAIGEIPDRLRQGFRDMLLVQKRMEELAVPGLSWTKLYEESLSLAVEMGYAENFMGAGKSRVSFIGHGLGLEIDEYPLIARGFDEMYLEAGMVFAFEPKLVFPGEGAVGIQNTFYLTDDGLKSLTCSDDE